MPAPTRVHDAGRARTSAFPRLATTSEGAWRRSLDHRPVLDLVARRAVVVSPHPDDETFACGGTIARLTTAGSAVHVVTVTRGEGSHPGHPGLAEIRADEQDRALGALAARRAGAGALRHTRLGLPDGRVADHEDRLRDALDPFVADADLVLAPWSLDGHTDHDASGRAASAAATGRSGTRLLAFPVWAWQWASPADLAGLDLRRVPLDPAARAAKELAMGCYPSQTTDLLGDVIVAPALTACFRRPYEVFADVG